MTLQRRHFELIAEIIRDMRPNTCIDETAHRAVAIEFEWQLARTNPNFNRARFLTACGVAD